jgi:hypothetical protein
VFVACLDRNENGANCNPPQYRFPLKVTRNLYFGIFALLLPWLELRESRDWVETPCVIERSGIKTFSGRKGGFNYAIRVRYSYKWGGEKIIGERYNFESGSNSEYKSKKEAVDRYPENKKTVCYVDPEKPWDAVLVREFSTGLAGVLFPILFSGVCTLVGLLMIIYALFYWRKRKNCLRSNPTPPPGMPFDLGQNTGR